MIATLVRPSPVMLLFTKEAYLLNLTAGMGKTMKVGPLAKISACDSWLSSDGQLFFTSTLTGTRFKSHTDGVLIFVGGKLPQ